MTTKMLKKQINKIVLIRPGKYPEGLIVPLGLLYLAGYLNSKKPDIKLSIIDAALEDLGPKEIVDRVRLLKPDLVGLTGLTTHTRDIKETAKHIRMSLPEAVIIAGGPVTTSNYRELLKEGSIDFGVIGEGEETFYQLVKSLQEGLEPSLLDGLVYHDREGNITANNERKLIEDIDDIPRPAYHLISLDSYFKGPKRNSQSSVYISKSNLPVITSRGCPFKCIFCHKTLGKVFRARSADNVVDEIIWLKRTYNIEELEIIDDIFNYDKARAKDIFKKLIDAGLNLKISFPSGIKYEMIDDELLDLFKKAGVYRLALGIESGNQRVQKTIGKIVDLARVREIIAQCSKMGFFVSGFFQLGIPGETKEEMMDTIRFAISTKLHTAMFHFTVPFPGTTMYEEYVKGKVEVSDFKDVRNISVNLSAVSDEELLRIKRYAFYKFYFNPVRIINLYRRFPVKKRLFLNFINVLSEIFFKKWIVQT